MPYSLPTRIMNLRIPRSILVHVSGHWFLEDGWSSSIVNRPVGSGLRGNRQNNMKCRRSKLKANFVMQGLRSSADKIVSLKMIRTTKSGGLSSPPKHKSIAGSSAFNHV